MFEFGTRARAWADTIRYDPLEAANHAIGDFDIIGATRALIIERDGKQSGDRSEKPAMFKRICLVDIAGADKNGVLEKIARIDMLNIADPGGVAPRGTLGGGHLPVRIDRGRRPRRQDDHRGRQRQQHPRLGWP